MALVSASVCNTSIYTSTTLEVFSKTSLAFWTSWHRRGVSLETYELHGFAPGRLCACLHIWERLLRDFSSRCSVQSNFSTKSTGNFPRWPSISTIKHVVIAHASRSILRNIQMSGNSVYVVDSCQSIKAVVATRTVTENGLRTPWQEGPDSPSQHLCHHALVLHQSGHAWHTLNPPCPAMPCLLSCLRR
jgi:hypothetical protein